MDERRKISIQISRVQKAWNLLTKVNALLHWSLLKGWLKPYWKRGYKTIKDSEKTPACEISCITPEVHRSKMQTFLWVSAWKYYYSNECWHKQQSLWCASHMSWCQAPGSRTAGGQGNPRRGISSPPRCLLPALAASKPGPHASNGKIASHLAGIQPY